MTTRTSPWRTRVSEHGTTLSGGEIRRLGIARALFGRKRLIVLDEPEANLDTDLVAGLFDALRRCRDRGAVVVVTSQAAAFADIADKIIVLGRNARAEVLATRDAIAAWHATRAERMPDLVLSGQEAPR
jgi:ABC-type protease/lipase transport system fused ATPase/permease subunit